MTFAHPAWFLGLALLPVLGALFALAERGRARALAQLVAARLLPRLVRAPSPFLRRLTALLLLGALGLAFVALARPQAGFATESLPSVGRDVLIAIDTSRSMLAPDIAPNRLARARLAAEDLIRALPGDRLGLVAFAGSAFLQAPLTPDHDAVLDTLRELEAGIIPQGGTNIAAAVRTALEGFGKSEGTGRALVLFTDGEELDADGAAAAREAAAAGVKLFFVGVGTAEGSVIPLTEGGYVKDPNGNVVRSRLDETRLRAMAEASSAELFVLSTGPSPAGQIAAAVRALEATAGAAREQRRPIERFAWPLTACMLLLAIAMALPETARAAGSGPRTANVLLVAFALISITPRTVSAGKDPHAEYAEGRYAEALRGFEEQARSGEPRDLFNLGTAAYRQERWEEAARAFGGALSGHDRELRAAAAYNLGNTLYQTATRRKNPDEMRRDLEDAIGSFDLALSLDPSNERAKKNRETAQKLLESIQQPPPQPKPKPEQGKPEDSKSESDDSKPDSSQSQQGQGDPQQGDGDKQDPGKNDGQKDEGTGSQDEGTGKEPGEGEPSADKPQGGQEGEPKQDGSTSRSGADDGDGSPSQAVEPQRERSGEIGSTSPQQAAGDAQPGAVAQSGEAAAEEAAAAREGRMTETQARALLESLRASEARVPLIERRGRGPVSKDW